MHSDHSRYFNLTSRSRLDKSINSLLGIIEGISVDSIINNDEAEFLKLWLSEHEELYNRHPYNELHPIVKNAIADGILTADEKEDIKWLCEKYRSSVYFSEHSADIQRLHGILGGIAADGYITETELRGLSEWLSEHEHLKTCWPYEEACSLIAGVLSDKKISRDEQIMMKEFFTEFTTILDSKTLDNPNINTKNGIVGLCAVCPDIIFSERKFCLTGTSYRYTRSEFLMKIQKFGGEVVNSVTHKLDYLIIGADGNPCWSYACYGRKIEKAVELRKAGSRLLLVHENDIHDAIADM